MNTFCYFSVRKNASLLETRIVVISTFLIKTPTLLSFDLHLTNIKYRGGPIDRPYHKNRAHLRIYALTAHCFFV